MNKQIDQFIGKKVPEKIPHKISEYISTNFKGECLTNIHSTSDRNGKIIYIVDVSHDNTIFHLKFNANGSLMDTQSEPLIEFSEEDEDYIYD